MNNIELAKTGLEKWIDFNKKASVFPKRMRETFPGELSKVLSDLKEPMNVLITGEFNAGKSTFINSLLGSKVLASDITPATAIITKLTYGEDVKLLVYSKDNRVKEFHYSALENLTAEGGLFSKYPRSNIAYVELQMPIELLKDYNLIDSPGLTSLHQTHTAVTESFLHEADAVIWLFNSLNVGTASEVEWLKKLYNLKIPIFGLVNGIDRLDEEEDLTSFYEYNERRLSPYIEKLDGISAKDILQGKIVNDSELLEWGNEGAVKSLFLRLDSLKVDLFYEEIKNPLFDFREKILKTPKAMQYFSCRNALISALQIKNQSLVKIGKEMIEERYVIENLHSEWEPYMNMNKMLEKPPYSILNKKMITKWDKEIMPQMSELEWRKDEIVRAMRKVERQQLLMEEAFTKIDRTYLKMIQSLRYFNEEKLYNRKIEKLQTNLVVLKHDFEKLEKSIKETIEDSVRRDSVESEDKILHIKNKWKNELSNIKGCHKEFSLEEIIDMETYFTKYSEFRKNILPYFSNIRIDRAKGKDYTETVALINDLKELYIAYDKSDEIEFYTKAASYKFEASKEFTMILDKKWSNKQLFQWNLKLFKRNKVNHLLGLGPHLIKEPGIAAAIITMLSIIF